MNRSNPSERELQVLSCLADGKTSEQTAVHLGLSKRAVQEHLRVVSRKLGAANRTHAVALATSAGLITPKKIA